MAGNVKLPLLQGKNSIGIAFLMTSDSAALP